MSFGEPLPETSADGAQQVVEELAPVPSEVSTPAAEPKVSECPDSTKIGNYVIGNENVRVNEILSAAGVGPERDYFKLENLSISSCTSSTTKCAITLNSSKYFEFVPLFKLPHTLKVLMSFLVDGGILRIDMNHILAIESWPSTVIEIVSEFAEQVHLEIMDSIIGADITREAFRAPFYRLTFTRCNTVEFQELLIIPLCHSLHFIHSTTVFVDAVLRKYLKNFELIKTIEICAEECSVFHSSWPRCIHSIHKKLKKTALTVSVMHNTDKIICFARALWKSNLVSEVSFGRAYDQIRSFQSAHTELLYSSVDGSIFAKNADFDLLNDTTPRNDVIW